jgi:hypothetical protein
MLHVGIKGFELETGTECPNNWNETGRDSAKIFKFSNQFRNLKQLSSVTHRRLKYYTSTSIPSSPYLITRLDKLSTMP